MAMRGIISADLLDQFREQVVASMNVANCVDALTVWDSETAPDPRNSLALTLPKHERSPIFKYPSGLEDGPATTAAA